MSDTEQGAAKSWITQRELQTSRYNRGEPNGGKPKAYIVNTKPLFSTVSLVGQMVLSTAAPATNKYGFIKFAQQDLAFFEYGLGDQVAFGSTNRKATPADTNISKGKQTNGSANFVIEGLSLHCRGMRAQDSLATAGAFAPFPTTIDPSVNVAIAGGHMIADPASILLMPQQYSPFNLENAMMQAISGALSFQLNWDQKRIEKIGTAFYMPQGGAGSELRSHGVPTSSNVAKIPEGYLWAAVGETDSELIVQSRIEEDVIVPVTLNENPDNAAEVCYPSFIWLDLVVKLHGFEFKYPSGN